MKKKPAKKSDPFTDNDKHVLNGIKLNAWTPERLIAAQSMGMLYPEIGDEGREQYRRTKLYPGAVKDTIICLWLCSQNEDRVDLADAMPVEAYREARKWAAKLKIHDTKKDEFWTAYKKFAAIMQEIDDARTVPVKSFPEGEEPDDETGNE